MNIKSPFIILLICSLFFLRIQAQSKFELDSLQIYLLNSKDKEKYNYNVRLNYALKAKQIALTEGVDSLIIETNLQLSSIYKEKKEYILYKKINEEALKLASKIKDSSTIAFINYNIGDYYKFFRQNYQVLVALYNS